ncbi:hypothetical protein NM208_g14616 [Fusarium decemcellulare]|uniref:Uncharacterized protein n=1 Tax=Fusarium decemcellulare TaxID=57161 RepID=A0ACC1RFF2_9HYPO|nr:hypothetical protein NM208_g14616 [Fusarium decemcellulare]
MIGVPDVLVGLGKPPGDPSRAPATIVAVEVDAAQAITEVDQEHKAIVQNLSFIILAQPRQVNTTLPTQIHATRFAKPPYSSHKASSTRRSRRMQRRSFVFTSDHAPPLSHNSQSSKVIEALTGYLITTWANGTYM